MIKLATQNGQPVPLYTVHEGDVFSSDGRAVAFVDLPDLIVAHASQSLQLAAHGRRATAQRFAREATALHEAYLEACEYRSRQQAARRIVARTGQEWSGK